MKTINVRDFQKKIRETVEAAQSERVVLTRHGDPVALVIGLEGMEWEDIVLQTSRTFWKMIEKRRTQKAISCRRCAPAWNEAAQKTLLTVARLSFQES